MPVEILILPDVARLLRVAEETVYALAPLREHRTRLIADVVTGKLDVREAAASLSDETETDTDEPDLGQTDDTLTEDGEDPEHKEAAE